MKIVITEEQLKVILEDLVNEQNFDQDFVDSILDKINSQGIKSITPREMEYLDKIRSDTSGKYIPAPEEDDEEPEDDESDLPAEFRSDYEYDPTKVENIEDAAEEFAILLDRYNLVKMGDMEIVDDTFIKIYSIEEEGLGDMFEGGHILAYVKKRSTGYILVVIVNGNLKDYVYDEVTDYINNAWSKQIPNIKLRIGN